MSCPNTLLAESTSDSTVLDYLSINGLLAQYVQKAGRLPFGYPTGLLAEIAHTFYLRQFLHSKVKIKQKIGTDNRVFLQSVLNFFMRIRYRIHTVYRIFFLPISTQK